LNNTLNILNSPTLRTIRQQQNRIAKLTSGIFDNPALKAMENITKASLMVESSSFKALQEQQDRIAKMISISESSVLHSINEMMTAFDSPVLKAMENISTVGSIFNTQSFSALQEQQNRIAKMTSGIFNSPVLKAMESITKASSLFDSVKFNALQEQHNSISAMVSGIFDNPALQALREEQNNFLNTTSLFHTIDIQKILDNMDISEIDETVITEEENSLINETLQVISDISPEIGTFIKSLELKKYKKATIFMMIWLIYNVLPIYQLYNNISNNDSHYKTNRDNVRVRLSPNKEDNTNVITKLNKNTYIEKLNSENGWAKIRFELDDGIEKEGWIYRTMLTKMD
jgi:predicted transcriptional regulator